MSPGFRPLLPEPGTEVSADAVAGPAPGPVGDRPHVCLNMIATLDGRAAIAGRTAPMGNPADRALFHALRARADAVMVGAGTARLERYGRMIKSPDVRRARTEAGRPAEPMAVLVSRSLQLPSDLPLLAEPQSRVAVITPSPDATLPPCPAQVVYVRVPDVAGGLRALRRDHGVGNVLCEGGPDLNATLVPAGLVDELRLALAPVVAPVEPPFALLAGAPPMDPIRVRLGSLHLAAGTLFARYVLD